MTVSNEVNAAYHIWSTARRRDLWPLSKLPISYTPRQKIKVLPKGTSRAYFQHSLICSVISPKYPTGFFFLMENSMATYGHYFPHRNCTINNNFKRQFLFVLFHALLLLNYYILEEFPFIYLFYAPNFIRVSHVHLPFPSQERTLTPSFSVSTRSCDLKIFYPRGCLYWCFLTLPAIWGEGSCTKLQVGGFLALWNAFICCVLDFHSLSSLWRCYCFLFVPSSL